MPHACKECGDLLGDWNVRLTGMIKATTGERYAENICKPCFNLQQKVVSQLHIKNIQHHRLAANVNAAVALPNSILTTVMRRLSSEVFFANHATMVLANLEMTNRVFNSRLII